MLWFDDPFANGVSHQLGAGMQAQFVHDILAVSGDGLMLITRASAISSLSAPSAR